MVTFDIEESPGIAIYFVMREGKLYSISKVIDGQFVKASKEFLKSKKVTATQYPFYHLPILEEGEFDRFYESIKKHKPIKIKIFNIIKSIFEENGRKKHRNNRKRNSM